MHAVSPEGDWTMPRISPDGTHVVFTNNKMDVLYMADISGKVKKLLTGKRVGYLPMWDKNGLLIHSSTTDALIAPMFKINLTGQKLRKFTPPLLNVINVKDQIFIEQGMKKIRISPDKGRYCCAVQARDVPVVAFLGMGKGLFVYDYASGKRYFLGKGNDPSFNKDASKIVFDRCEDDGMNITHCDLIMAVIRDGKVHEYPIDVKFNQPMYPSISDDGKTISFVAQNRIWVGSLNCD